MTPDGRSANLMFLLTLSPLAAGCPGDDAGTSNTTTPDPTTSTSGADSSGPGTGPGTGSGSGSGDTTGPMDTTASTDSGSSDTTDGLDCEPDPRLPTEIDPLCEALAELQNECYYDGGLPQECIDLYEGSCQYQIEYTTMISEACAMAWNEVLVCLTGLTCEQIDMGLDPCMDQFTALDMDCRFPTHSGVPRPFRRR